MIVIRIDFEGMKAAFEKAAEAMRRLARAIKPFWRRYLEAVAIDYEKKRGRIPGSCRTKRLRKKRMTAIRRFVAKEYGE